MCNTTFDRGISPPFGLEEGRWPLLFLVTHPTNLKVFARKGMLHLEVWNTHVTIEKRSSLSLLRFAATFCISLTPVSSDRRTILDGFCCESIFAMTM